MQKMLHPSDPWSTVVIVLTFVLFFVALFLHGFTSDLLLETGIFLVSLKLIRMGRSNAQIAQQLDEHLTDIENLLRPKGDTSPNAQKS
jgi:Na+-translocating ferredoxin:NAD+ oxidoreductase RnfE subunit